MDQVTRVIPENKRIRYSLGNYRHPFRDNITTGHPDRRKSVRAATSTVRMSLTTQTTHHERGNARHCVTEQMMQSKYWNRMIAFSTFEIALLPLHCKKKTLVTQAVCALHFITFRVSNIFGIIII